MRGVDHCTIALGEDDGPMHQANGIYFSAMLTNTLVERTCPRVTQMVVPVRH